MIGQKKILKKSLYKKIKSGIIKSQTSANVFVKRLPNKYKGDLNDERYIQKCLVFRILAKIR